MNTETRAKVTRFTIWTGVLLLAYSILIGLTGCASVGNFFDPDFRDTSVMQRYQWRVVGKGALSYKWQVVTRAQLYETFPKAKPGTVAIASYRGEDCTVYSTVSEQAARSSFEQTSIRTHELRHCGIETPDGLAYDHQAD